MRRDRALLVFLMALALIVAAVAMRQLGTCWVPGCLFRMTTGLECPGCGMTRGTYALLHGRWNEAFWFNPVGMIVFPIAMIALGVELVGWVFGRPIRIPSGRWSATVIATVVIGWFIGRNWF